MTFREGKEAELGNHHEKVAGSLGEISFLTEKSRSEAPNHEEELAALYEELKTFREGKEDETGNHHEDGMVSPLLWQGWEEAHHPVRRRSCSAQGLNGDESDGFDQSRINISQGIFSFFLWQAYRANLKISSKDLAKLISKNMVRFNQEWCCSPQACSSPGSVTSHHKCALGDFSVVSGQ
jgi:hypothetical protein